MNSGALSLERFNSRPILYGLAAGALLLGLLLLYFFWGRAFLIFAAIAAIPLLALIVRYPIVGLLLVTGNITGAFSEFVPMVYTICLYGTLMAVGVNKILAGDYTWRFTRPAGIFALFLVWMLAGLLWTPGYPPVMWIFLRGSADCLLIVLLVSELVRTPRHFYAVLAALGIGTVFSAASAIQSTYTFVTAGLNPTDPYSLTLLKNARFYGHWGGPNALAHSVMPFGALFVPFLHRDRSRKVRVLATVALGGAVIAVAMTLSRAAIIGLFVALAIAIWVSPYRRTILLVLSATIALTVVLLPLNLMERVASLGKGGDASINERSSIYRGAIESSEDSFPLGGGTGAFNITYWGYLHRNVRVNHAHNTYLHVLSEGGLLGLILLAGALAAVAYPVVRRPPWESPGSPERGMRIALAGCVAAITLAMLFEHLAFWHSVWTLFALASIYPHVFGPGGPEAAIPAAENPVTGKETS